MSQIEIYDLDKSSWNQIQEVYASLQDQSLAYLYSPQEWRFLSEISLQKAFALTYSTSGKVEMLLVGTLDDKQFTYWGRPLQAQWFPATTLTRRLEIAKLCAKFLKKWGIIGARFYDDAAFTSAFINDLRESTVEFRGVTNLALSDAEIRASVRKSYRSLCNWGQKNFSTTILEGSELSWETMESMRQFHKDVSGRETRSKRSWEIQWELIRAGSGYVVLSKKEERLISAILILHGKENAFYAVAVNERQDMTLGDPLGHWPLLVSILHAKKKGLSRFEFGPVISPSFNEKEKSIAVFKRGFTQYVESSISFQYAWEPAHE